MNTLDLVKWRASLDKIYKHDHFLVTKVTKSSLHSKNKVRMLYFIWAEDCGNFLANQVVNVEPNTSKSVWRRHSPVHGNLFSHQ